MKKVIEKIKVHLLDKKGASMMEYFILSVVALLIGAVVFELGASVRTGVRGGTGIVDDINGRLGFTEE